MSIHICIIGLLLSVKIHTVVSVPIPDGDQKVILDSAASCQSSVEEVDNNVEIVHPEIVSELSVTSTENKVGCQHENSSKIVVSEKCDQMCTMDFNPVCGNDGTTYPNDCALNVTSCLNPEIKLVKIMDGECKSGQASVCSLSKITGPCRAFFPRWYFDVSKGVCLQFVYGGCRGNGNNFQTLRDCQKLCMKRRAQNTDDAEKLAPPCVDLKKCPMSLDLVCGSDEITYINTCFLESQACSNQELNLKLMHSGKCAEKGVTPTRMCDATCDNTEIPVCGSDDVTYKNLCQLHQAACLNPDKEIQLLAEGKCIPDVP